MKNQIRVAVVMLLGTLVTGGVRARPNGPGGGPGGHGGGGRSSGLSSGRGVGHALGHSFGHLFGRHGNGSNSAHDLAPPLAGAAVVHGKIVQLPGPQIDHSPAQLRSRHWPIDDFPFGERFLRMRPRAGFGFDGCAGFGFPHRSFFFHTNFDCFGGGFFFNPFLMAGLSGEFVGGQSFLAFNDRVFENASDDSVAWPQTDAGPMQSTGAADFPTGAGSSEDAATHNGASGEMKDGEPLVTLLQLRDGSMYGLVDYWVEDGRLHYKTTYGAQNSIELDRIDLEQTVHLNADRGVQFMLRPKHPSASVPPAGQTSN
jgi:hypothetical protein